MLKLIARLYRQSWRLLTVVIAGGIVSGLSSAALVAIIGRVIEQHDATGALALSFAGLCVLQLASKAASELALLQISQSMIFKLRISLSRKLLATPLRKLQSMGPAALLAILTEDLSTFATCSQLLPILFGNAIVLLACLGYIAWLSWQSFLALVLFLVAGSAFFTFAQRGPARRFVEAREQTDVLFRDFRSLVEGAKELQLNQRRAHHFIKDVLEPGADKLRRAFFAGMAGYTWVSNLGSMQFFIALGILVFGVSHWFPQSSPTLPMVALMLLYLVEPVGALLTAMPTLQRGAVALNKAQALSDSLDDSTPAPALAEADASPFAGGPASLVLSDVRYVHHDGERGFAVGPLNLEIPLGRISYIVGPNGSGKTTLAMLLLGLYSVEQGRLTLHGVDVTPDNLVHYRNQFTAVFADFHLFERLLEPVTADTAPRVRHYLSRLEIDHKVSFEDGRFSTLSLSTGQRKRLTLLVSYLEDRAIYLFDEWASDQDPVFKRVFYTELLPELRARGKTVIVITHDDQYYHHADHLFHLVDGSSRTSPDA
ncbi:cyclic peptide export ABC transporter [Burkholderia sp. 22PA0099]|uniref:cyclic peptide export ABC transporter n=1 Tax=Burkholderia sp. 22PA0099 TaxID=3237372 RepID=UPI0039C48D79